MVDLGATLVLQSLLVGLYHCQPASGGSAELAAAASLSAVISRDTLGSGKIHDVVSALCLHTGRWSVLSACTPETLLCCAQLLSCVQLFATPKVAHQTPLSMGILQARILQWAAIPSSRGPAQPRD